jgi:ubiquinol-cytochrome c reductase cytochrome b subunit
LLGKFCDWFDHRTGYRRLRDAMLLERIPGGAKWRYVWGSTLAFVFFIQLVTGVLLMTAYSPGDSTAWGSVYFIQYVMDFGWLIRGLHHFGSQTMVVLLGVHMLQVVIAGAHLPPREVNWWLGLALMGVVLGLSLTGYLLPWDQKGFFATQVATNILGSIPGVGEFLQKVVVGGPVYGNQTLTHFYSLHVGILPPLLIVLLIAHVAIFRRHGLTTPKNAKGEGVFWPDQAFRDMVVCMLVFGVMLALVIFGGHGNKIETPAAQAGAEPGLYERMAKAGRDGLGANLDAPADPLTEGYPARPEWYFLFLFQLLKYFEGEYFLIGALVIPNGVAVLLALLPLLGYGRMRKFGHVFGVIVVVALLLSVAALTVLAMADDSPTPYPFNLGGGSQKAKGLHEKFKEAELEAQRAVQLAAQGIPEEGGRYLLRGDPMTRGPKAFKKNCAVCHSYNLSAEQPSHDDFHAAGAAFKASDLHGFASEKWIRGLLDDPGSSKYFGLTKLEGMKNWRAKIDKNREKWKKRDPASAETKIATENGEFDTIAKWLAGQAKPKKDRDAALETRGRELFDSTCASCHKFRDMSKEPKSKEEIESAEAEDTKVAPNLWDYGSAQWIRGMIMNPAHPSLYGKNNEMPAFRNSSGPGAELLLKEFRELQNKNGALPNVNDLSDTDRELIVRWLTRDYRVIFGGKVIAETSR